MRLGPWKDEAGTWQFSIRATGGSLGMSESPKAPGWTGKPEAEGKRFFVWFGLGFHLTNEWGLYVYLGLT